MLELLVQSHSMLNLINNKLTWIKAFEYMKTLVYQKFDLRYLIKKTIIMARQRLDMLHSLGLYGKTSIDISAQKMDEITGLFSSHAGLACLVFV